MRRVFVAFLLCCLVLGGCKKESQADIKAQPVIKIGVNLHLTGQLAHTGKGSQNAIQMAFEKWKNKDTKYRYELIFEDDMMKTQQAAVNTQKLIHVDGVRAILSLFGLIDRVVDDISNQNKIISVSCSYGKNKVPEYGINTGAQNEEIYAAVLEQLKKENVKSVVLQGSQSSVSFAILDYFALHLSQDGIAVLENEKHNLDVRDFRTSINKSEKLNPDYYLIFGVEPMNSIFVKQYREITGKNNLASLGSFPEIADELWPNLEGLWAASLIGGTDEFSKEYEAHFHDRVHGCSANLYDGLDMLITAFENTPVREGKKLPDNKDVVNYLRHIGVWKGAFGTIEMDTDGIGHPNVEIWKMKNGKWVKIEE